VPPNSSGCYAAAVEPTAPSLGGRRILLVVSGGIAAYKSLDLIRRLRERGAAVRCVLTAAACEFITPLAAAALSEDRAYTELFSLDDESEMGHIQLSREAHLVVVAPATANLLAKMASGIADDLASTLLLATDKPVLAAPAMNVRMWLHPATRTNVETLRARGVALVGPEHGDMACGESGPGRMAEPAAIVAAVEELLAVRTRLAGRRVLVTAGPTHEPIDPVRFLGNRSSGKQGYAVAEALAAAGAETVLVSGPTAIPPPAGVELVRVETAEEMLAACRSALPVHVAVCAAAVADWRVASGAPHKLKKSGAGPPVLELVENPDILATLSSAGTDRPSLVVGFAAETEKLLEHAAAKRRRKGCDWIVANDVSAGSGVFGGDDSQVVLLTERGAEEWPRATKAAIGRRLVERIAEHLAATDGDDTPPPGRG